MINPKHTNQSCQNANQGPILLLIDDDPNLIFLTKDYLEYKGFQVFTAESGMEGLELVQRYQPDLIICDVMMPIMNGYDVVESVRQDPNTKHIPILFLTAKSRSKERLDALNAGVNGYVVKPFEPEALLEQINLLLKQC
jgi:DNA-binding response OmpR family regulator